MSDLKKLHLGCGRKKALGAIGIDFNPQSQADIIHDLNQFPWPLDDNAFDHVICEHVLEHLSDIVATMQELHRVCKLGAMIEIITPHFSSVNSWVDPTHKHHFALESFDYFCRGHPFAYSNTYFEIVDRRLTFNRSFIKIPARILYAISPRWYEKHFAFMMPARTLKVMLRVCKNQS